MDFLSAEMVANFHFLRPWFLLGLIPAVLMLILLRFAQTAQSSWNKAIDPQLLPYLLDKTLTIRQSQPLYGLLLIWSLSIVALAGPVWEEIPVPVQEREDALVIVMDLSLSMYSNDLTPNRLTRATRKLLDVLNLRKEEGQTALVVYAGDAHTVTPLTDDVATISNMVPALAPEIMPALGSKPAAGINMAINLLDNANLPEAQILLITDGINRSDINPIRNSLEETQHVLSILGAGTDAGAPIPVAEGGFLRDQQNAIIIPRLQSNILQDLASATAGRYTEIRLTDEDVNYLLDQSVFDKDEDLAETEREFDSWYESGPWLLLLALPFAALAFRKGWLFSLVFLVVLSPQEQAYAWEIDQLWKNKDQKGRDVFEQEDYAQAANLFKDEPWRAAANYKNQNYDQALQDLALKDDIVSNYNRGNTLAHLSLYEDAIAEYDKVLATDPNHSDAIQNKEIVQALLQEQQEQEQQEQEDSESSESQDQQNQQEQEQSEEQQQGDESDDQQESEEQQQEEEESEEQSDQESDEDSESDPQEAEPSEAQAEQDQAMQQWLGRIKDDPGELLRNKFQYQAQQRLYQQLQNPNLQQQQAEQQIW